MTCPSTDGCYAARHHRGAVRSSLPAAWTRSGQWTELAPAGSSSPQFTPSPARHQRSTCELAYTHLDARGVCSSTAIRRRSPAIRLPDSRRLPPAIVTPSGRSPAHQRRIASPPPPATRPALPTRPWCSAPSPAPNGQPGSPSRRSRPACPPVTGHLLCHLDLRRHRYSANSGDARQSGRVTYHRPRTPGSQATASRPRSRRHRRWPAGSRPGSDSADCCRAPPRQRGAGLLIDGSLTGGAGHGTSSRPPSGITVLSTRRGLREPAVIVRCIACAAIGATPDRSRRAGIVNRSRGSVVLCDPDIPSPGPRSPGSRSRPHLTDLGLG